MIQNFVVAKIVFVKGGSPGLVVMGGDSWSKGRGFKSQHCMLDGHFSHLFVAGIVMFVRKEGNKRKRGRDGPFLKIVCIQLAIDSYRDF